MRTENGDYPRKHPRALAQGVEVDTTEIRIIESKARCCVRSWPFQSAKTAGFGMPSFVPKWRPLYGRARLRALT
jgi:site-specific DNA recombinase